MIQFGIGDAILHYPALIRPLTHAERAIVNTLPGSFVAVHAFASTPNKSLPEPAKLVERLLGAGLKVVMLGNEPFEMKKREPGLFTLPPLFNVHLAALREARKFIGTLSSFNCAAQVMNKPSYVLVNMSVKEPFIYDLMVKNFATVVAWNDGTTSIDQIYADAAGWAQT